MEGWKLVSSKRNHRKCMCWVQIQMQMIDVALRNRVNNPLEASDQGDMRTKVDVNNDRAYKISDKAQRKVVAARLASSWKAASAAWIDAWLCDCVLIATKWLRAIPPVFQLPAETKA